MNDFLRNIFAADYKELFYDWMGGNDVLFLLINSIHGDAYDKCMWIVSWLGDHKRFPLYVSLILVIAAVSMIIRLLSGQSRMWFYFTSWLGIFVMLGSGYAVNGVVTMGIKDHFSYPRPYVALASAGDVRVLEAIDPNDDFTSFPSGHVTFSTFMVVALWPILSNFFAWSGVIFIVLVAWSRVALGMHFPADVVGGIIIAAPLIVTLRVVMYGMLRKFFRIKC